MLNLSENMESFHYNIKVNDFLLADLILTKYNMGDYQKNKIMVRFKINSK